MMPGRNDPCSCGSGKKFKHCCEGKTATPAPAPALIKTLTALYNTRKYSDLENRARLLVEQYPDSGHGWKFLGGALQAQGKDALPAFQTAAQLLPNDAEAHYNLGIMLTSRGRFDEALINFHRVLELKPGFAPAWGMHGNVMKQLGDLDEAVKCYRRLLEIEPDNAQTHCNLGSTLNDLGQLEDAVASFRQALRIEPNYAEAHGNLGVALRGLGQLEEAVASCRRATELRPDLAEAHNNLGITLRDAGQFDAARESYLRALALKPGFSDVHRNLGIVLKDLGDLDSALASYRQAVKLRPDFTEAHSGLGLTLLLMGQFSEGWKEYRWGIHTRERLDYPVRVSSDNTLFKRNAGDPLPAQLQGMQITLLKDQGLGDELFFLRFAKELQFRGARVVYVADPRVASFIRRAKWVDHVAEKGEPIGESDAVLFVSELPHVLVMAREEDIPPPVALEALPEKRKAIALRLDSHHDKSKPLIGITWRAGGDRLKKQMAREIPLGQLAAALRGIQATFVIVQRNPQPGEITAFETALGQPTLDCSDLNDDLEGMLALMERLDDYIGVDNTNMHLRASAGKSAGMLVPHLEDFRCMAKGDSSPWFPGFTIYRKTPGNDWDGALEQIRYRLRNLSPTQTAQC